MSSSFVIKEGRRQNSNQGKLLGGKKEKKKKEKEGKIVERMEEKEELVPFINDNHESS